MLIAVLSSRLSIRERLVSESERARADFSLKEIKLSITDNFRWKKPL